MPRNYKKEYENYHSTPKAKKQRATRNAARRAAVKAGKVSKGDGKDIDHKKPLRSGGTNAKKNIGVKSKRSNRAANGHKAGERQRKWK